MKLLPSIYLASLYCSYVLPAERPLPTLENCSISWRDYGTDLRLTWFALESLYNSKHPLVLTQGGYSHSLSPKWLTQLCTTDLNLLKTTIESRRNKFDQSWLLQHWASKKLKEIDALYSILKLYEGKKLKKFLKTVQEKNEAIINNPEHYKKIHFTCKGPLNTQQF